jgi:hypothetical protein
LDAFEVLVADECAADRQKRFVDVGAAVVAAREAAVVVQPREGALDDPALRAKTRAVGGAALGDLRCDAARS